MAWVGFSGSLGVDHSANATTVSAITGAGNVLLATIASNPKRNGVGVQNQSTGVLYLVRSDGGSNTTIMVLSAAAAAGGEGGDWFSQTFKGQLTIYGASGSQVAAWED